MSFPSVRFFPYSVLVAVSMLAGAFAPAALAADDGQAPIWVGIGGMLGLVDSKEELPIEYRERSKLVLPPKIVLPPPAAAPVTNLGAWPVDPDVQRVIRNNDLKQSYVHPRRSKGIDQGIFPTDSPVTVRADAGQGPPTRPCVTGSPSRDCQSPGWPLLSTLGFGGKADPVALGPEPDRNWLTDPPKGYRAPLVSGAPVGK